MSRMGAIAPARDRRLRPLPSPRNARLRACILTDQLDTRQPVRCRLLRWLEPRVARPTPAFIGCGFPGLGRRLILQAGRVAFRIVPACVGGYGWLHRASACAAIEHSDDGILLEDGILTSARLYYQPQVSSDGKSIVGVECLLRSADVRGRIAGPQAILARIGDDAQADAVDWWGHPPGLPRWLALAGFDDLDQHQRPAVSIAEFREPASGLARRGWNAAEADGTGVARKRHHRELRDCDRDHDRVAQERHPDRAGRFRHGLFEPGLSAEAPDRQTQARQVADRWHWRTQGGRHRPGGGPPCRGRWG